MWAGYGAPSDTGAWHIDGDGKYVITMENCPENMTQAQWMNTLTIGHPLPTGLSNAAYAELEAKKVKKPESEWTTYEKVQQRDIVEANEAFAAVVQANNRWCGTIAFAVRNNNRFATFHYCNTRVCCP